MQFHCLTDAKARMVRQSIFVPHQAVRDFYF